MLQEAREAHSGDFRETKAGIYGSGAVPVEDTPTDVTFRGDLGFAGSARYQSV
jgi:hypothetical protein